MRPATGLRAWIAIGHPRYRRLLAELLALALGLAGLVYLENTLLTGFVRQLAGGASLPVAWLAGLFGVGLVRAVGSARSRYVGNDLAMRSRGDLEAEVFAHLLHRDDDFYRRHGSGEILNRLEVDLHRVLQRRETVVQVVASTLVVLAHLAFFARCDLRLALVVMAVCLVGTLVSEHASRPVRVADKAFWGQHDRVKVTFDDCLKALVEIQVGGLFAPMLERLGRPQASRLAAFRQWARADAFVAFSRGGWPVVAFLLATLVVLTLVGGDATNGAPGRAGSEDVATRLALIPVLVYALPGVFSHVTYLATLRLEFQLARNAIDRLLEYESAPASACPRGEDAARGEARAPPVAAGPVRFEHVTYRYTTPDGELQGGVDDVSLAFETGRWTCLVGPAGAGKSTVVNLALGRALPQGCRVLIGDRQPGTGALGELAAVATILPQTVVLLDDTLRANLYLGDSGTAQDPVPDADLELLEAVGLADVCRRKALELHPSPGQVASVRDLARLRERAQAAVRECGARLVPFEDGRAAPGASLSWHDHLVQGSLGVANPRQQRRVDEALLAVMSEPDWRRLFVSEGLRYEVGRHGSRLSGGQAQLVGLARALLRRTPFLILDEPTSALDPASRDRVASFLRGWCRERVVVTISHDPGLARQCDEILMLQGGRLIDRGGFDELASRSAVFRELFRLPIRSEPAP